jgi:hypothetical protein
MRFALVNGRTPCLQSFYAPCCKPIGASYLREIEARLSYCAESGAFSHPSSTAFLQLTFR